MSTKSTLKHHRHPSTGESFHLYEERFEDGQAYLELGDSPLKQPAAVPS